METLSIDVLAHNAYRVLGLPASATQADVDSAARKMRIWEDPSLIPPTLWDRSELGDLPRNKNDIEQAVSRLSDPRTRLQERLWWYCGDVAEESQSLESHDRLLSALVERLQTPDGDVQTWRSVIDGLHHLATSQEYLSWLLTVEDRGDFEKRANAEETRAALISMPQRLIEGLAASSESMLDHGDVKAIAKLAALLRVCEQSSNSAELARTQSRLLDRVEDLFVRRCTLIGDDVSAAWQTRDIGKLSAACSDGIRAFDEISRVDEIVKLASPAPQRAERMRQVAARLLWAIANAYGAMNDHASVERVLERALQYAEGLSLEASIREKLERVRVPRRPTHLPGRLTAQSADTYRPAAGSAKNRKQVPGGRRFARPLLLLISLALVGFFVRIIIAPDAPKDNLDALRQYPELRLPLGHPRFTDIPDRTPASWPSVSIEGPASRPGLSLEFPPPTLPERDPSNPSAPRVVHHDPLSLDSVPRDRFSLSPTPPTLDGPDPFGTLESHSDLPK